MEFIHWFILWLCQIINSFKEPQNKIALSESTKRQLKAFATYYKWVFLAFLAFLVISSTVFYGITALLVALLKLAAFIAGTIIFVGFVIYSTQLEKLNKCRSLVADFLLFAFTTSVLTLRDFVQGVTDKETIMRMMRNLCNLNTPVFQARFLQSTSQVFDIDLCEYILQILRVAFENHYRRYKHLQGISSLFPVKILAVRSVNNMLEIDILVQNSKAANEYYTNWLNGQTNTATVNLAADDLDNDDIELD